MEHQRKRRKIQPTEFQDLNEYLLIEIFEHLSIDQRKTASLVCFEWYQILTQYKFSKEFPLTIKDCIISPKCPPLSVLMKTERPFRHIVLGENIEWWTQENINLFIEAIGESVWSIAFPDDVLLSKNFCTRFVNLREMSFSTKEELSFFDIPDNVNKIHVESLNNFVGLKMMKKLYGWKELTGKLLTCKQFTMQTKTSRCKQMIGLVRPSKQLVGIMKANECNYVHLIPNCNLLRDYELGINDVAKFDQLVERLGNFNYIEQFSNLTTLSLKSKGICFKFHKKIELKSVSELELSNGVIVESTVACRQCLSNFKLSLPNVTSLTCSGKIGNVEDVIRLFKNTLKHLELENTPLMVQNFNLHNLVSMSVQVNKEYHIILDTDETIPDVDENIAGELDFLKHCPKIKKFTVWNPVESHCMQYLVNRWPSLQEIDLYDSDSYDFLEIQNLVEAIAKNCKNIKSINFGEVDDDDDEDENQKSLFEKNALEAMKWELFKKIPSLRYAFNLSYKDYCKHTFVL